MGTAKSRYNGWTHGHSPETVPKINPQHISCFDLLSFNSSVDQQDKPKRRLCFFTSEAAECKSGSVIFPTALRELSGLSLHPDVYIFLHVLSHPLPSFCLTNFQSVRPSISPLLLFFLPRSCSFSIIYGLFLCCYPGFGWGLDGWSVGGGMGGGWFARFQANWNIHVCVPVSLCESAFTCTPPWASYTYVCLFMSVVWSGQLLVKRSALICVHLCACVCVCVRRAFCQVMRKAPSFDLAPKIRLGTSITHELLCTRSHDRPRRRN